MTYSLCRSERSVCDTHSWIVTTGWSFSDMPDTSMFMPITRPIFVSSLTVLFISLVVEYRMSQGIAMSSFVQSERCSQQTNMLAVPICMKAWTHKRVWSNERWMFSAVGRGTSWEKRGVVISLIQYRGITMHILSYHSNRQWEWAIS